MSYLVSMITKKSNMEESEIKKVLILLNNEKIDCSKEVNEFLKLSLMDTKEYDDFVMRILLLKNMLKLIEGRNEQL